MCRGVKLFSLQLALLVLLSAAAFGETKEDADRALLAKSLQQANLWADGPVKLVAKVRVQRPEKQDLNLIYEISWERQDKWRAEWRGAGYSQITLLNNGKLYSSSSLPTHPLLVIQFEQALGALNPYSPATPWAAPVNPGKSKIQISNGMVGKTNAKCLGLAGETWCIDPVSAHTLSFHSEMSTIEYKDYTKVGEVEFPQSLRLTFGTDVQEEGTVSVTHGVTFADSLFVAPPNSTASDFPPCADIGKNFAWPHLLTRVQPTYPQTERVMRHEGTVRLYVTIGEDGAIRNLQVIDGAGPELNKSAMDAVQQWKYSPFKRCGQPAEFDTVISVMFSLNGH